MRARTFGLVLIVLAVLIPPLIAIYPTFTFSRRSYVPEAIIVMIGLFLAGIIFQVADQEKFSTKRRELINQQSPCPICKKSDFQWGDVPASRIRLRIGTGQLTWARVCKNCGNVQQFTKTD
jgi:hypothetical protein